MKKQYEDTSNLACKGDKNALKKLFNIAKGYQEKKNYVESTNAFKDSAIAYRISALRNLARAEDAERSNMLLQNKQNLYKTWIENNLNGLRKLPLTNLSISDEFVREIILKKLINEQAFVLYMSFLESALSDLGYQFFSPGGSVERRTIQLVSQALNNQRIHEESYFDEISVRVPLDLIIDEVIRSYTNAEGYHSG